MRERLLPQESRRQLRHALVAFVLGAGENLLDKRSELLLAPIVSRRAFGASSVAGASSLEERFSCRLVLAGIIASWK
ncbi:MAG TPA: hypothetical protein VIM36_11050 [Gemmatimonadaceae bacterium]